MLNLGSLNIGRVYHVAHIARPGETIAASRVQVHPGGKGANQSVALARAGAAARHLGCVGPEGGWLRERLAEAGVDTAAVLVVDTPTGHTIIQVDGTGENAIVLFPGANHAVTPEHVEAALQRCGPHDWLLTQHETSAVPEAIIAATERGLRVCFNPAPMSPAVRGYPLERVELLVVNETEGAELAGEDEPDAIAAALAEWTGGQVVLTLGAAGALWRRGDEQLRVRGERVEVVDSTAAGDTFTGYLLAGLMRNEPIEAAMIRACRAAALCVGQPGAMPSIPTAEFVGGL